MKEKKKGNVITLPENVTIDMGDREILLEKGDHIEILSESLRGDPWRFREEIVKEMESLAKYINDMFTINESSYEQNRSYKKQIESALKNLRKEYDGFSMKVKDIVG